MTKGDDTLGVLLLVLWLSLGAWLLYDAAQTPAIERCAEDVVLVGTGDYEDGRYDRYVCGPAMDDYK
jgi:hypothetical protein